MKYHIITFGCQMNISDSERIASILENMKLKPAKNLEQADLVMVNMCSVRQSAVDRIYGLLPKIKNKKTVLTGCFLKKDEKLFEKKIDHILPIKNLNQWPKILQTRGLVHGSVDNKNYFKIKQRHFNEFSALVPIMTGCNNFCSYCVVPYTRGREISRPAKEIICEVKNLVKRGAKEIWLLGQNVNSYGVQRETTQKPAFGGTRNNVEINFPKLLKLVNDIPGKFWIRFTSSHPKDFSDDLIKIMKDCKKVTPYLNLPVQSGDDEVLRKMNRPYKIERYKKIVKKLKKEIPDICLSADFIVGFPGETEKHFNNTKKLFEEIKYDMAYINKYSPRAGTAAFKLKDNVSPKEKKKREKILTDILKKTALENNKKFEGKTIEVLPLEPKKGYLFGKSFHYKTVRFKGPEELIGKFVKIKIKKSLPWGLEGKYACPIANKVSFTGLNKLVVILGPTSSGKTDLSIKLAEKFNGEIVSADSRQVYKGMDIGTGKITKKEMKGIPHHLLDVARPKRKFTVAQYKKMAEKAIKNIQKRNKIPFLVGGTGFYINAVIDGLIIPPVKPDWDLRKKLEKENVENLFKKIKKLDPKRAEIIDPNNKRRLIRALEIILKTKKPVPLIKKKPIDSDVLILGIKKETKELSKLIHKRLIKRLRQGMIVEVKKLRSFGVSWKRLEEFGLEYRYAALYLQNKITKEQMIEKIQKESERYAKRQMTWFRRYNRVYWIKNEKKAQTLLINFLG